MTTSIVLARFLGPYLMIVAIGVLCNVKTYERVIEDILKNSAVVYLSGVLALIFGLLMVQFHNVWIYDWRILITFMGWLGILKGIRLIVFPGTLPQTIAFYQKNRQFLMLRLVIFLILGAVLVFFGYFAH